jgi:small-conductance mechanosensitive channel
MTDFGTELLYFAGALGATGVALVALHVFILPLVRRATEATETDIDQLLVGVLTLPVYLAILVAGVYVALLQLSPLERHMGWIRQGAVLAATLLGFYAFLRAFNALMRRHVRMAEEREEAEVGPYVGVIRKLVNIGVFILLVLLVLGQLGYKITPLLTSLGIAGVAVALALQDTLGNLFAGFYILFDRPLKVGDYVQLDTGDEGFVEEIGWRNTKIRPWANNIIVIPNAKLAQSVIVNHHLPQQVQKVYIPCGVDYNSDLEHVERVCIEVGKEVMARIEGTDETWEPVVRFKEFADSNINFLLVLQIKEFGVQYLLSHECVKALHKRFREEGIEISWPVSKLVPTAPFEVAGAGLGTSVTES